MPRKQRFKPSRKPSSNLGNQVPASGPQVDDRKEIQARDQEVEREAPARDGGEDIERDRR